jgi:hypothetical protein
MSNALAVRQPLTPQVWEMINSIAPAMHQSRLFGVTSPHAAAAIMLKGYELGLPLTASFEFIHVIDGKPGLNPRGALAILQGHPETASIKITSIADQKGIYQGHEVTMKRKNGFEYTTRFTLEDAKKAGLVKPNSGWEKYPQNMCLWRAVGFCADVVFPDVIGGMKRVDELGAEITADGNVIEGEWLVQEQPVMATDPAFDAALTELVEKYTPEAVILANGGQMPASFDELMPVASRLVANEKTNSN